MKKPSRHSSETPKSTALQSGLPETDSSAVEQARQFVSGWRLAGVAGFLILAAYVGRETLLYSNTETSSQETMMAVTYDAYSSNISSVLYKADGSIDYTLEAVSQIHYLDDTTVLEMPDVELYQNNGTRWNIVARSGRIHGAAESDTIDRLDLSDDVQMYQTDITGNRMTLATTFISLFPATESMDTDREVIMTTNSLLQTAIGMHADLQQDKLTFFSQVRGRYEVQSSQP